MDKKQTQYWNVTISKTVYDFQLDFLHKHPEFVTGLAVTFYSKHKDKDGNSKSRNYIVRSAASVSRLTRMIDQEFLRSDSTNPTLTVDGIILAFNPNNKYLMQKLINDIENEKFLTEVTQ